MRIPWWIWLVIGLSIVSWIVPDGIPGEEFILPAIAVIGLLLRRRLINSYKQQYQQYQQGQTGASSAGTGGAGQSSNSFYSRFRNWNPGFQPPPPGSGPQKDPYDILGVRRGAGTEEIKRAYRDQLKKYHPDKVASLKLDPEYREMFEEKTREIQKAYEALGGK